MVITPKQVTTNRITGQQEDGAVSYNRAAES